MAKREITVCDRCSDEDEQSLAHAVECELDGARYTIDLCETHERELKLLLDQIRDYMRTGKRLDPPSRRRTRDLTPSEKNLNEQIRAWAVANGHELNHMGRIPQTVLTAYYAAQTSGQ